MTFGSLFAGIGGFDLGLERAGMECRWQVEIDPYCRAVLAKHWPEVHRHDDIRTFRDAEWVDLICGGFPCQDISVAGRGLGLKGERSGLWSEYRRVVGELRPRYVIVENVTALLHRGIGEVLGDLAALGYDAEWHCIPASAFGAPHERDRVWIVAYSERKGLSGLVERAIFSGFKVSSQPEHFNGIPDHRRPLDVDSIYLRARDGVRRQAYRIRSIGNAVVPQVVESLGRMIMEASS